MFAAHNAIFNSSAKSPVVFKGVAVNSSAGTVTLPSHQSGDLILIWASNIAGSAPSVTADAGTGTVPNWQTVISSNRSTLVWAKATASNLTSGSWGSPNSLMAVVLSRQGNTPIGNSASNDFTVGGYMNVVAPAITASGMSTSMILHFAAASVDYATNPPTGYTTRITQSDYNTYRQRLVTKDVSTSAPSVTVGTLTNYEIWATTTVEIKA